MLMIMIMMMMMMMMMVMRITSVTCLSTSATPYFPCCTTLDIIADHYHDNEADGEGVIGGFLSSYKLLGFHQQNLFCPASLHQSKTMFVSQIPGMIHLDTCQDSATSENVWCWIARFWNFCLFGALQICKYAVDRVAFDRRAGVGSVHDAHSNVDLTFLPSSMCLLWFLFDEDHLGNHYDIIMLLTID